MRVFESKDCNLCMVDTEYGLINSITPMLTAIKIFEINKEIEIKFNENQKNYTNKVCYNNLLGTKRDTFFHCSQTLSFINIYNEVKLIFSEVKPLV
jgi:hypothetical protein